MSHVETEPVAVRWIDETFTVVDQNRQMTDLTERQDDSPTCREQLSGPYCGTDECALFRLREGDETHIEERVEMETASGRRVFGTLAAERYTTGAGDFEGIIETFELANVQESADGATNVQESADGVTTRVQIPDPVDSESFRTAVEQLLSRAASNDVSFENRSWDLNLDASQDRLDLQITTVGSVRSSYSSE